MPDDDALVAEPAEPAPAVESTPARSRRAARPSRPARAARGPRPEPEGAPAVISSAFTMVAIVCLWMVAQMLVLSTVSHDRAQAVLYREFRTQLAATTAPLGPIVPVGDPVALLSIPAIDLQEVVVEGTASGDTLVGPGHRRDTVLPGQVGGSLVYGRATTYGAPFRDITSLPVGAGITVTTAQGEQRLTVLDVRRAGDPVPPPPAAGVARLTLVTAEGEGRLAGLTADTSVYVDAEGADGFPAPPGRPTAVPETEQAMATDSGALPLLALCLALLLAMTLAVVAARQRWNATLVWVIASPLAIALAWVTTDTVMRLLPNVI